MFYLFLVSTTGGNFTKVFKHLDTFKKIIEHDKKIHIHNNKLVTVAKNTSTS